MVLSTPTHALLVKKQYRSDGSAATIADATAVKDKRPRTVQKVKRILIDAVREREEEGNVGSGLLWSGGGQEACFRS